MARKIAFCLLFCLVLCACGAKTAPEEGPAILSVSPLLQTVSEEGAATRLIPTEQGVIALWGRDGGFAAAYLSSSESVLVEELCRGDGSPDGAGFLETEPGKGILACENGARYVILNAKGAEARSLGEGIRFTGVFYRNEGLICQKGGLLLLIPADLSEPLVLTDTAAISDCGEVLTASPDGRRVWCARRNEQGAAVGLVAFCPGETKADREIALPFDGAVAASEGRLLLWRCGAADTVFTLLDPVTEEAESFTVSARPDCLALSPAADRLALWDKEAGRITLFDFSGAEKAHLTTADLGEVTCLCFGADGTLYAALRKDAAEVLVTLA